MNKVKIYITLDRQRSVDRVTSVRETMDNVNSKNTFKHGNGNSGRIVSYLEYDKTIFTYIDPQEDCIRDLIIESLKSEVK